MTSTTLKKLLSRVMAIVVIIGILYSLFLAWNYVTYEEKREYSLIEIEDGVYAHYQVVVSNVPAHNYDIIVVNAGGNILTLKGNVNIHDSDQYRLVWTDVNVSYGDTFDVYIPIDSVQYLPASYSR